MLSELDARIFHALYAARGGAWTPLALFFSAIGSGWVMFAVLPLAIVARWRRFGLWLSLAVVSSATLVYVLKLTVGRHRPCVSLDGVQALCPTPGDPSFPSGHAGGTFTVLAFVLVALHSHRWTWLSTAGRALLSVVLVALALGVAWSRIYLGVHFPSDVTVGAVLGASIGAASARLWLRREAALSTPTEP